MAGRWRGPGLPILVTLLTYVIAARREPPCRCGRGAVGCAMHGAKPAACGRKHASPWPNPDRAGGNPLLHDAKSGTRGLLPRAALSPAPARKGRGRSNMLAAVDENLRARDVACILRAEKIEQLRHLLRLADAFHRDLPLHDGIGSGRQDAGFDFAG